MAYGASNGSHPEEARATGPPYPLDPFTEAYVMVRLWNRKRESAGDDVADHSIDYRLIEALREAKPILQKVRQVLDNPKPGTATGNVVEDHIRGVQGADEGQTRKDFSDEQ
jgi:hypothetical protein